MTFARVCSLHYEKFSDGTVKCIEDEIPFEIPDGWAWARVFNVSTDLPYGTAKKSYPAGKMAVLRMGNLQNGEIVYRDLVYSSDEEDIAKYSLCPGDLLFNRTNSAELVGKTAIYRGSVPAIYAGYLIRIHPLINPEFLNAVMNSQYAKQYCYYVKADSVSQSNINANKLGAFLIPIPPANEQKSISKEVSVFLPIISALQEHETKVKELCAEAKSRILNLAIRGKLVPQDPADEPASVLLERIRADKEEQIKAGKIKRDKKESFIFRGEDNSYYEKISDEVRCIDSEIPYTIPGTWTWCRGWSCFKEQESVTPPAGSFLYIDIDSIDNTRHVIARPKTLDGSDAPSRARRRIQTGSVVFSLVRPYLENIALVTDAHSGGIASTGFYVCSSEGMMIPSYMFLLMTSRYVVHGLNQFMKGDNSPSISKNDIEQWLYPIPPICEQREISKAVDHFFELIQKIEQSLN